MTYDRPCPDGNHEVEALFEAGYHKFVCRRCPINVSVASAYARSASNMQAILRKAFLDAERDWFIKELES